MGLTEIAITEFGSGVLQLQWRRQRDGDGDVDGDNAFCFHLCATCRGRFQTASVSRYRTIYRHAQASYKHRTNIGYFEDILRHT